MPITVRGDSYQVTINHKRQRIRRQFPELTLAKNFEAAVKDQLKKGIPLGQIDADNANLSSTIIPEFIEEPNASPSQTLLRKSRWTLRDVANKVFEDRWKDSRSEETYRKYCSTLNERWGTWDVNKITSDEIEIYGEELREINSGATINKKLSCLHTILDYAFKKNRLDKMPYFPRYKEALTKPRFLKKEEVNILLKSAHGMGRFDLADAITISISTGIRQGNLLGLKIKNVDLKEKVLRFTAGEVKNRMQSNDKGYSVPLNEEALEAVKRRLELPDVKETGKLFGCFSRHGLGHQWKHLNEVNGMSHRWHDLRHTFGSWLVQSGVDIATVSRLMNHASIQVTMRYAYLAPSNYHDSVANLRIYS